VEPAGHPGDCGAVRAAVLDESPDAAATVDGADELHAMAAAAHSRTAQAERSIVNPGGGALFWLCAVLTAIGFPSGAANFTVSHA
jgi:hypothetical protein